MFMFCDVHVELRFVATPAKAHPHAQVFTQCSAGSKSLGKTALIYLFLERERTKSIFVPQSYFTNVVFCR